MTSTDRYIQALRWQWQHASPVSTRRRAFTGTLLGWPVHTAVVTAGRAADRLLVPGFGSRPIRAPVFIVGHPRSGTTFLHRLLARDRERFVALETWQSLLPSITLQSSAKALLGAEGKGGPIQRLLDRVGESLFAPVATHHDSGWRAVEEDSLLFLHQFAAPHLEMLAACPEAFDVAWFPDALPADERRRWLRFYRRSLQRNLHGTPLHTQVLAKSPTFSGWLQTLSAAFPDAYFVRMDREPSDAIASFMQGQLRLWHHLDPSIRPRSPELRRVFERSCRLYAVLEATWPSLPAARRHRIRYDALIADPRQTIGSLYAHFGWEVPSDMIDAATIERAARRIPRSTPPLRSFGIRDAELRRRLKAR